MKMSECTSRTWTKVAEIPTNDFSLQAIEKAIIDTFGEPITDDIEKAIKESYIEICEDGFVVWVA